MTAICGLDIVIRKQTNKKKSVADNFACQKVNDKFLLMTTEQRQSRFAKMTEFVGIWL